jgi:hypothetical protein
MLHGQKNINNVLKVKEGSISAILLSGNVDHHHGGTAHCRGEN